MSTRSPFDWTTDAPVVVTTDAPRESSGLSPVCPAGCGCRGQGTPRPHGADAALRPYRRTGGDVMEDTVDGWTRARQRTSAEQQEYIVGEFRLQAEEAALALIRTDPKSWTEDALVLQLGGGTRLAARRARARYEAEGTQ